MEFAEGVPCWVDAMLPDVEGGKRFYGELFGWTFDSGAGPEHGRYAQALLDGEPVAALAPKPDGRMPTTWTVYLATPDAATAAARVTAAGGQVITEPVPVGAYGTMGLVADPEGAVFGLWQAGGHPGFGALRKPGAYCWTEVHVRDKSVVDPFYEAVFGYGGHDVELGGEEFRTWSPEGAEAGPDTAVGGRAVMSASVPAAMPAHFLSYFAVADCDATAAAARHLGGRVRTEPYDIPYGRVAVLVDNQGAAFGILQD
ncbi:27 kDa antigen Cfp30B [Streptomyces sp. YIM 121038]|uniref:VOC family protein n=1 Tax=Streptomyces sp. YIM 121038 TaxID=2136401 RepID=UPI001110E1A7|nr:VOC family protein [Streptomyces sp. YIM 121038]QCX77305.1 27 kDa antigen Cfp30B [Streptomyces sp. YIM 121038]